MPRARKVYVLRPEGGTATVFVAHPHVPGVWIRTDASVLVTECPDCNAPKGEPCRGKSGGVGGMHHGWTHYRRRAAARGKTDTLDAIAAIVFKRCPTCPETAT